MWSPGPNHPIASVTLVLAVLVGTASCSRDGEGRQQKATEKAITADAGQSWYGNHIRYLRGIVTGHPDHLYYTAEIEINHEAYALAGVWTLFDLSCGEKTGHHEKVLLDAIRTLAPIGTPILAVRGSYDNHLFVHTNPPNTGPSMNEQLVRSGFGRHNQSEARSVDAFEEARPYFRAVEEAQPVAEAERAGTWGVCHLAAEKQQAQYAAEVAAMEKRIADSMADVRQGGSNVSIDWGDGHCDTCRAARRIWNFFD